MKPCCSQVVYSQQDYLCVSPFTWHLFFFYFKQIRQTLVTQKHENGGGPQKRELTSLTQCEQANTMPTGHSFFLCEYTHLLLNDTTVAQWTLALVAFLTTSFSYCKIIECLPLIVSVFNSHDRWLFFFSKRCAFSPLKKKDKGEILNNFFFFLVEEDKGVVWPSITRSGDVTTGMKRTTTSSYQQFFFFYFFTFFWVCVFEWKILILFLDDPFIPHCQVSTCRNLSLSFSGLSLGLWSALPKLGSLS